MKVSQLCIVFAAMSMSMAISVLAGPAPVFFYITEGAKRCFLEDVPEETLVVGRYKNYDAGVAVNGQPPAPPEAGIRITVRDPMDGTDIYSTIAERDGKFAFTSHDGGEYSVCIEVASANWFGHARKFKFELHLDVGEHAINYDEIAKIEHLTAIEVEIRKLTDIVRGIRSQQAYSRSRERAFRNTSESTNSRVVWWSIFQTLFLVGSGIWQITYLKNFFRKKKLV